MGNKHRLLPQILPLFPKSINTFYDLFCGGCDVGINVKANKVVCNDILFQLINLFNSFKYMDSDIIFYDILRIIKDYNLSNSVKRSYKDYGCDSLNGLTEYNKKAYLKLRSDYNNMPSKQRYKKDIFLYVLLCYSFSNQIRFNKKNEFNTPYGKRDFNKRMRKNLRDFLNRIKSIDIDFVNKDFREFKNIEFKDNDFVYCDPPYLISEATYNRSGKWTKEDELDLFIFLDMLHSKNIKFALSNVLKSKGKSNDLLKKWAKKYNINYLNMNYSNCNYQRKSNGKKDVEVLITNY